MHQLLLFACAAAVAIAASGAAGARSAGAAAAASVHVLRTNPPIAHTGGFGEPTCVKCHQQYPLNDTTGSLQIEGVPERYKPGERYRITVAVQHRDLVVAGFQLTARYDEGARAGKQAGRFALTDTLVAITSDSTSDVKYVHHSTAGVIASAQRGKARFSFDWIAPEGDSVTSAVVFHAVANAGNDDFSELGDYIFARSVRIVGGGTQFGNTSQAARIHTEARPRAPQVTVSASKEIANNEWLDPLMGVELSASMPLISMLGVQLKLDRSASSRRYTDDPCWYTSFGCPVHAESVGDKFGLALSLPVAIVNSPKLLLNFAPGYRVNRLEYTQRSRFEGRFEGYGDLTSHWRTFHGATVGATLGIKPWRRSPLGIALTGEVGVLSANRVSIDYTLDPFEQGLTISRFGAGVIWGARAPR